MSVIPILKGIKFSCGLIIAVVFVTAVATFSSYLNEFLPVKEWVGKDWGRSIILGVVVGIAVYLLQYFEITGLRSDEK